MDSFCVSGANKTKLQSLLASEALLQVVNKNQNVTIILSGLTSDGEDLPPRGLISNEEILTESLDVIIEEADLRVIPHALLCARSGYNYKRVVILSHDTDVLVISLYYWSLLRNNGLQECWIRVGVANTTRYIPIHTLADNFGQLIQFLPAIHALTWTDKQVNLVQKRQH